MYRLTSTNGSPWTTSVRLRGLSRFHLCNHKQIPEAGIWRGCNYSSLLLSPLWDAVSRKWGALGFRPLSRNMNGSLITFLNRALTQPIPSPTHQINFVQTNPFFSRLITVCLHVQDRAIGCALALHCSWSHGRLLRRFVPNEHSTQTVFAVIALLYFRQCLRSSLHTSLRLV